MADWCRAKAKSLAVQDIINRWKVLNKIFADEVIGRLSKVEYALPNGAMSDLRHLLAESQRLQKSGSQTAAKCRNDRLEKEIGDKARDVRQGGYEKMADDSRGRRQNRSHP